MQYLYDFLQKEWDQKSPLLIGYSGGTDSKALFYALLEWGKAEIHLAHVDHGWRETSAQEAEILRREAAQLGVPFHTIRLDPPSSNKNLEAEAREKRTSYFLSLFHKFPFQALLLAHHRDDLAETTLKRVFEGAHLSFLGGMKPISHREKMTIWRPLLSVKRAEILQFLKERNLSFIDDPTNRNPSFLRSRMRVEMFPVLNQIFGKNISENLSWLSLRAEELREYLDRKVAHFPILQGPWGICFELPQERIEARHLLQKFVNLSRIKLEEVLDAKMATDWQVTSEIFVDRGWIFILNSHPPRFGEPIFVQPGHFRSGDWKIQIEEGQDITAHCDWKKVWTGQFSAEVERQNFSITLPPSGRRLRKIWSEKKVPSFLRNQVPILVGNEGRIKEFLSGLSDLKASSTFKITFSCDTKSSVQKG